MEVVEGAEGGLLGVEVDRADRANRAEVVDGADGVGLWYSNKIVLRVLVIWNNLYILSRALNTQKSFQELRTCGHPLKSIKHAGKDLLPPKGLVASSRST